MKKIKDHRGLFILEDQVKYDQIFISTNTHKYTFRGLHYQSNPYQVKYISVIQGKIVDYLYDLNTGEVKKYILTPDSEVLVIEENYAHGYLTLEPNTILYYGVKGKFNPNTYSSIIWNTIPNIKKSIEYYTKGEKITISEKDKIKK